MLTAPAAIPPKPKMAAIIAMMKNIIARRNIMMIYDLIFVADFTSFLTP